MQVTRLMIAIGIGVVGAWAVIAGLNPSEDPIVIAPTVSGLDSAATQEVGLASNVQTAVDANFGPLADMVGKTWRGEPQGDSSETSVDIQSWEAGFGGAVLIIRHAIENGNYGGDTYVYRNGETGALDYVYITNAGFHTTGSFDVAEDGSWSAEEAVTGQGEITRVRSTGKRMEDGSLVSSSEYFKGSEWVPGHSYVYRETDQKLPTLKPPAAE